MASTLGAMPLVFSTLPPRAADAWVEKIGAGSGILLDVAYDPWPSALAQVWGGTVISGLHMLVHQAVEQVRLFASGSWDESRSEERTSELQSREKLVCRLPVE